jgi:cation diffusion facilitator family transporter
LGNLNPQDKRAAVIKKASLTALVGNLVLAVLKITGGLSSGSLSVLGDGIDSSVDVLIAALTLFISGIISRPADKDHPWGHGRAETIGTAGMSFLLFFAGFQLIFNSAKNLISVNTQEVPEMRAVIVTLISIAGKFLLVLSQYQMGKKADSRILMANAKNMASDVFVSAGVLAGLFASMLFDIGIIDSIVAILVGLWVIKSAAGIFLDVNTELMDGGSLLEQYRVVFDAVHSVPGAGHPHRARMRRVAGFWDIDIDIEVDGKLTVSEAHKIATKVEDAIRERLDAVFDIMVHIEPKGCNAHKNEAFGLNEESVLPETEET